MVALRVLDLSQNRLQQLPSGLEKLEAIVELNLSYNRLDKLPSLKGMIRLSILSVDHNSLTELPELNVRIIEIHAIFNNLTKLAPNIGDLKDLAICDVTNNRLNSIPEEMGDCKKLRKLNLFGNQIRNLPDTLGKIPTLIELNCDGAMDQNKVRGLF